MIEPLLQNKSCGIPRVGTSSLLKSNRRAGLSNKTNATHATAKALTQATLTDATEPAPKSSFTNCTIAKWVM